MLNESLPQLTWIDWPYGTTPYPYIEPSIPDYIFPIPQPSQTQKNYEKFLEGFKFEDQMKLKENIEPFLVEYGSTCKDKKTGQIMIYDGEGWIHIPRYDEDKEIKSDAGNANLS
jgi:hypothetical protein